MKSRIGVIVLLFFLCVSFVGCANSSNEEAVAAVQKFSDFQEIVQTLTIGGSGFLPIEVHAASPLLTDGPSHFPSADHVIIYKTKTGGFRIIIMSRDRPPILTGWSKEFK